MPPAQIRDLRDLTRSRAKLSQQRAPVANRIQKVLEDANLKLGSVATDVLGRSGRSMLEAMIRGCKDPDQLADLAVGRLRAKLPALRRALAGFMTDHHRFLLRGLLAQWAHLESEITELDAEIRSRVVQFETQLLLLRSIPGVDEVAAWSLLAELGANMSQFPSNEQLASWAGLCPGNYESAGKRIRGTIRKGNPWLRQTVCQAAWAASRTKNTYFQAQFRRLASRRGRKRALIAVAHSLLIVAYQIMRTHTSYRELGSAHFDQLRPERLKSYLLKRLLALGYIAVLQPAATST